jgi:5-oxoprolinase (ATP-hydrolysing) subunit A
MLLSDFNCDMGEGMEHDEAIMPFITSANIACGYHAGDDATMLQTLLLAKRYGVKAGAHPSYPDRENFGRREIHLTPQKVYQLVTDQIKKLQDIASTINVQLHHVKPHGALYNMAAKDEALARSVAKAVRDVDANLMLFGLSGSCLISAAKALGLATKSEAFADRTYDEDGNLTPRSIPGSLITNELTVVQQVLEMVYDKKVTTKSGRKIPILAETICLHGDGVNAVAMAKLINKALKSETNTDN